MPRRVQDIVPSNHRSIRDIPIERNTISAPIDAPKKRAGGRPISIKKPAHDRGEERGTPEPVRRASFTPPRSPKPRRSKKILVALILIVIVVAGSGYVASAFFSQASFTVTARTVPFSVDSTYVSQHGPGKGIPYEIAVVSGDATASVPATDGPTQSTSAKGKVTVYNAYSTETQRLIAGTRLADKNGNVYRLTSSITIPGYKGSGSSITPGSTVVEVTADKPGEEYNILRGTGNDDFTIVAYEGTPRYSTMYAKLNTDIVGGFVGVKKTVASSTLAATVTQLREQVTQALLSQIADTIPEGYVMYPDSHVAVFSDPVISGTSASVADVTVRGTVYGVMFKEDDLVRRIAGEEVVADFSPYGYTVPGLEDLEFSIANPREFSPEKKNSLIIKLKGQGKLIGVVPIEEMKSKLAGLDLTETPSVLRPYKPVIKVEGSSGQVVPPWAKIPTDTDRISIEVLTE